MYAVDGRDKVVRLDEMPQSDDGAPMPLVISDEGRVVVAYYGVSQSPQWDAFARLVDPVGGNDPIAVVRFIDYSSYMFGAPNDEAFSGHPLASRGLKPYGAFRIEDSSWIRNLEAMNSVHPGHDASGYQRLKHLVLSFHDTTFECVCAAFDVRTARGSIHALIPTMARLLYSDRWKTPVPPRPLGEVMRG